MIFPEGDIKKIIQENKRPAWISLAREYTAKLSLHTKNEGVSDFLERIEGLETLEQKNLRDRFYISNKHIIASIQRQADNIWTARGGAFVHDLGDKSSEAKFMNVVRTINDGSDLYSYMQESWFEGFRSEPCGATFIEIIDGNPTSLRQLSINEIFWCDPYGSGARAILFEPTVVVEEVEVIDEYDRKKKEERVTEYFQYIDTEELVIFEKRGNDVKVKRGSRESNVHGIVPVVWNSFIKGYPNMKIEDDQKMQQIRLSVLNDELSLLETILRKNSVKEVHEFLHAYPVFWQMVETCNKCGGFGAVDGNECPTCDGVGFAVPKKDVANVIRIGTPEEGEQAITPPAGYEVPPVEIIQEMRAEIKDKVNDTMLSHWGVEQTETVENPSDKTATEIITDIQPKINRLSSYTDNVETHHNAILDIIVRVMFPGSKKANVRYAYGRGYVLETSDTALKRYFEARNNGVPDETLNHLLVNYYASLFRRDSVSYERAVKLMQVEPLLHLKLSDVKDVQDWYARKLLYNEWRATMKPEDIDKLDSEKLREEFYIFVKNQYNGKENSEQFETGQEA